MSQIFWSGVGSQKIYFDGKKLYFVNNPEGLALWIFVLLLVAPFLISFFDFLFKGSALKQSFEFISVTLGFAICILIFIFVYLYFFRRKNQIPGDKRKTYISYDIERKVLEEKKKTGEINFIAYGNDILVEFPVAEQILHRSKNIQSFGVFFTYNNMRHVIARDIVSPELEKLVQKFADFGLRVQVTR